MGGCGRDWCAGVVWCRCGACADVGVGAGTLGYGHTYIPLPSLLSTHTLTHTLSLTPLPSLPSTHTHTSPLSLSQPCHDQTRQAAHCTGHALLPRLQDCRDSGFKDRPILQVRHSTVHVLVSGTPHLITLFPLQLILWYMHQSSFTL